MEDVAPLATFFFRKFRSESRGTLSGFHEDTVRQMCQHDWPGNVRELRNAVHRACVLSEGPYVMPHDLPRLDRAQEIPDSFLDMTLDDIEQFVILTQIRRSNGNKTEAARRLGITAHH